SSARRERHTGRLFPYYTIERDRVMQVFSTIAAQTARRYVLGRQGLWPGRRWQGIEGTEAALRQMEAVQIDPIHVLARNHDLVLWSRVAGYAPELLEGLLYRERRFFDFGNILMIYPMEELAVWQAIMRRIEAGWKIGEQQ